MPTHANDAAAAESYVVRRATSDDVDAIARIWHTGWIDGHLGHVPPELVRRHRNPEQFVSRARHGSNPHEWARATASPWDSSS
jgi:hypothetical protein